VSGTWWRQAVVYEVYVRSFADSDGDGLGDLEGLRGRLQHLCDLGVDAVWITPFYPSPMADHGYDVADYCDVDPRFGDLAAFDRLLADAHALGLKVIVDLVPNHTSSAHPWFQEAVADPSSPARARYWFRDGVGDGPPNNWQSVFGGPAWTRDEASGQWYLHLFDSSQPDLDWANREVHEEFLRILRFWLDRGVDGFRIDVAHSLYVRADLADDPSVGQELGIHEDDHRHIWDQEEVQAVYEEWRAVLDSYDEPGMRMMVGEVFLFDVPRVARYVSDTRLHQAFNFTVFKATWGGESLRTVLQDALAGFDPGTWVLSNHDLIRHVTRYGGGDLGRRRGLAVSALLFALPGSPYLYQGEELGLDETDVPDELREDPVFLRTGGRLAGRDGCRTPMPWSGQPPGHGFTTGTPWLPFGPDARTHAVDLQEGDQASVLGTYRRLLARRRALLPELPDDVAWLPSADDVLAVGRGPLVVVLNTAAEAVEVEVGEGELLEATAHGAALDGSVVTVPAAATVWVRTRG
jgi:alpha-glucosidase